MVVADDETRGIGPGSRGTSGRLGNKKQNIGFFAPPHLNNIPGILQAHSEKEKEAAKQARAAWKKLYPDLPSAWKLPVNVTFKPLSEHPYGPMRVADDKYDAWTNSPTEIYVIPVKSQYATPDKKRNAYWRVILYHEAWHLKQFAKASEPPKTYAKMMEYEEEAYRKSYEWIKNTKHPKEYSPQVMSELGKNMKESHTKIDTKMSSTQKYVAGLKNPQLAQEQLEQEYWLFLDPPTHTCLEELYGQRC